LELIELAGLLTYPLPEPSHPPEADSGRSDPEAVYGFTAAGTVQDLHLIPFSVLLPVQDYGHQNQCKRNENICFLSIIRLFF
jgi:hypothetical protein